MNDEREQLERVLDGLQAQLEEMRKLNPAMAASLDQTIAEAKRTLAGQPAEPAKRKSLVERLRSDMLRYEASHPTLAGNLGSLIDALAGMGI
jgi:hypothetical protein